MGPRNTRKKSYASIAGLDGRSQEEVRARNVQIYGSRIRAARQRAGMTTDDLASQLGVTRSSILNWENGYARPDLEYLARTFRILDMDPNAFFELHTAGAVQDDRDRKLLSCFHALDETSKVHAETFLFSLKEAAEEIRLRSILTRLTEVPSSGRHVPGRSLEPPSRTENQNAGVLLYRSPDTDSADEIIAVRGNTMEPLFHDGDRVLVQYAHNLLPGELGILSHPTLGLLLGQAVYGGTVYTLQGPLPRTPDALEEFPVLGRVLRRITPDMLPTAEEISAFRRARELADTGSLPPL